MAEATQGAKDARAFLEGYAERSGWDPDKFAYYGMYPERCYCDYEDGPHWQMFLAWEIAIFEVLRGRGDGFPMGGRRLPFDYLEQHVLASDPRLFKAERYFGRSLTYEERGVVLERGLNYLIQARKIPPPRP